MDLYVHIQTPTKECAVGDSALKAPSIARVVCKRTLQKNGEPIHREYRY